MKNVFPYVFTNNILGAEFNLGAELKFLLVYPVRVEYPYQVLPGILIPPPGTTICYSTCYSPVLNLQKPAEIVTGG